MINDCYKFENIEFTDGLFDDCVDATYIIHLKENERLTNVQQQLEEYHPTNKVFILYNKGPGCEKNIENNIPPLDLVDAFLHCFKHAEDNNYDNILILEDDFIFDKKIKENEHIQNICNFIKTKNGEPIMYRIGCIPLLQIPYSWDFMHNKGLLMGTHSVIYNKAYCDKLLQIDQTKINDWDIFNNGFANSYTYYTPLCYQLFPETENSKYWGQENILFFVLGKILFLIFQFLGLNKSIEPGYSFFYTFSKFLFFIVFGILFCLFYWIFKFFKIKKLKK
jgi:hypothetical protein